MNIGNLKNNIIDKIKFVFDKNKILQLLTNIDADKIPNNQEYNMLNTIKNRNSSADMIFKKIKILFNILSDLIKYSIILVDKPKYQKVEDNKIVFPNTVEKLIIIMGIYDEAFDSDIQETLYRLINKPYFEDLYKISTTNIHMIPFVVGDDSINVEKLKPDYESFRYDVRNILCDILKVNTEFETSSLID